MGVVAGVSRLYLVSGGYDPNTQKCVEGSLELVSDRIVLLHDHKGKPSLNMTDERGMIVSVGAKGELLHPVQRLPLQALKLAVAPPGTAMASFAAYKAGWQNKLLETIGKAHVPLEITTIPIKFTRDDLRPPDSEAEKQIYEHFASGAQFRGQMLLRQRCLVVLFETAVLRRQPESLSAKLGGVTVALARVEGTVEIPLPDKGIGGYVAYAAFGHHLKTGDCVVSIKSDDLNHTTGRHKTGVVKRTFPLAFGLQSLFGEVEIHVFEMPSLEASILLHFGSRYPHLMPTKVKGESPKYAASLDSIQSARANLLLVNAQKKMIAGLAPKFEDDANDGGSFSNFATKLSGALEKDLKAAIGSLNVSPLEEDLVATVASASKAWAKY